MRKIFFLLLIICVVSCSCKTKEKSVKTSSTTTTVSTTTTAPTVAKGTTLGKVSHQYRATGCATVIIVTKPGVITTLIPKDTLSSAFDVDGLEIYFNYRPLKMPNPAGCTVGIPALISDISKK